MKTFRIFASSLGRAVVVIALGSISLVAAAAQPPTVPARVFRAGAATSNITPPLGAGIVGNFEVPPATHIHDELHVRCLALDDGQTRLVFAVVDNVSVNREVFDEAKGQIRDATGVPTTNLLMSATHTHSATNAGGPNRIALRDYTSGPNPTLDAYQTFLVQRIVDGVRRALNNLEPARIAWGAGQAPQHVFNRRWLLKEGHSVVNPFGGQDRAIMNPGSSRTDLLEPAGPTNPEVQFISVRSTSGRPIALLANYWLHFVGGVPLGHISSDYFGVFSDRIQELLGADRQAVPFVGLMANGPCGDVNAIDIRAASRKYAPYEKIKLVADDLAQEVLRVHRTLVFHDWVELKAAQTELVLRTRRPASALVAQAEKVLARPATVSPVHRLEKVYAERTLTARDWPDTISVALQAFRIGDLAIAAIPFETFAETGLAIKAASPFKATFTIELANGGFGYLPPPRQHEVGGYETWLGTNRVEVDAARKIELTIQSLLRKLE